MAKWHNEHHNYGYALMLLVEACVTFCCEELRIDYDDFNERKLTKKALVFSDDQKKKKDVITRRIQLIKSFSNNIKDEHPYEEFFDEFILGRDLGKEKSGKSIITNYQDYDYYNYESLTDILTGKDIKGCIRNSYGNGFKTQNANRNLIAHNGEGKKSYKTIISELKFGIVFLKKYLDSKPKKDF